MHGQQNKKKIKSVSDYIKNRQLIQDYTGAWIAQAV